MENYKIIVADWMASDEDTGKQTAHKKIEGLKIKSLGLCEFERKFSFKILEVGVF